VILFLKWYVVNSIIEQIVHEVWLKAQS